jgi:hypothetical protein
MNSNFARWLIGGVWLAAIGVLIYDAIAVAFLITVIVAG